MRPMFAGGALVLSSVLIAQNVAGSTDAPREPVPVEALATEIAAPNERATPPADDSPAPSPDAEEAAVAGDPADADEAAVADPSAAAIPQTGSGVWVPNTHVAGPTTEEGTPMRVAVRVEEKMPINVDDASMQVIATLQDPRGWQDVEDVRFELVTDPAQADVVISIASPDTVDEMCAPLNTRGELSCRTGQDVVLNAKRWMHGTDDFTSLEEYREYLINHEIGHALGHGHVECPAPGEPAPVMLQQTISLEECVPNAWPSVA